MSDLTLKILQEMREEIAQLTARTREDIAQLSARMDERFDGVHSRIDDLDTKVTGHGVRLEHIEGAIVAILNLIGRMNHRLDAHDVLLNERAR